LEDGGPRPGEILDSKKHIESDKQLRKLYRFGSLTFAEKKKFLQLQAADILSYEMWKQSMRIHKGEQGRDLRMSLQLLLPPQKPYYSAYYDKDKLGEWLRIVMDPNLD
jgi:hypothetical protein